MQEEYEKMEQQYEAAKEERYRLFQQKQEERKKLEEEHVQSKNEKTLDNIHKRLCFLTQDQTKIYNAITESNCVDLNKYKQVIIDNDLLGIHLAYFGSFNIKELIHQYPLCFKPITSQDEKNRFEYLAYGEGAERWRVWWGQPLGPLHIEIGIRETEYDPSIYIMEGDSRYIARTTTYSIESGLIFHDNFNSGAKNAIHQRLLQKVFDLMIEKHPIMPIHNRLYNLTQDPMAILATITKNNSPNLYALKDRIDKSGLIYKHW